MTTIPNELIININTSIPGYQKIKYIPSMTIKNIDKDDKTIRFDPLIKLNKCDLTKNTMTKIKFRQLQENDYCKDFEDIILENT